MDGGKYHLIIALYDLPESKLASLDFNTAKRIHRVFLAVLNMKKRLVMAKTKEEMNAYQRQWRSLNKDKVSAQTRRYNQKNRDKVNLKGRLLRRKRNLSKLPKECFSMNEQLMKLMLGRK